MFPYVWNDEKDLRFFEDNRENMGEISSYLEAEYNERNEKLELLSQDILDDCIKRNNGSKEGISNIIKEMFNIIISLYIWIDADTFSSIVSISFKIFQL